MHHRELGDYGGSSVDPPRPPCPPCPPYLRVSVSPWFLPFVRSVRLVVQGPTERRPFALRSGRQVVGFTMFHSDLPDRGHRPLPLRNGPAGFGGAPTGPGASGSG